MVSVGPTQEACIKRVEYFLSRLDAYNAGEAIKDVDDGPEATRLYNAIYTLKMEELTSEMARQIALDIERDVFRGMLCAS